MRDTIILIIDAGLESGRPMFSVLSGSQFMRASFCVLRFQMPLRFGDHFLVPLLMLGFLSWNLYGIFNLKLENYILLVLEMLENIPFFSKNAGNLGLRNSKNPAGAEVHSSHTCFYGF